MTFLTNLDDALTLKNNDSNIILIISIETLKEDFDLFWNSIPVKTVLQNNFYILRINKNSQNFQKFSDLFNVYSFPSLCIIGQNSTSITQIWEKKFPTPSEFNSYFHTANFNAFSTDNNDLLDSKTILIFLQTPNGKISKEFSLYDTILDVKNWIKTIFDNFNEIRIVNNQQLFPNDNKLTLKEANIQNKTLLQINILPNNNNNNNTKENNSYFSKFLYILSFLNPFINFQQEDFWEYQPNENIELPFTIAENRFE